MPDEDSSKLKLAAAVADDATVDWTSEVTAASGLARKDVIRQLQVIAGVAAAHRQTSERIAAEAGSWKGLAIPGRWGRLEIRREIGRGGFGVVYLAWDPALERDVALKVLHASDRPATVVR
jgi:hypothetical protein